MTDWRSQPIGMDADGNAIRRCPEDVRWCDRCGDQIRDFAGPRCFGCRLITTASGQPPLYPERLYVEPAPDNFALPGRQPLPGKPRWLKWFFG